MMCSGVFEVAAYKEQVGVTGRLSALSEQLIRNKDLASPSRSLPPRLQHGYRFFEV